MAAPERHEQGRITDEGIAKLRERIGKGFDARQSWRTEINRDTIWTGSYYEWERPLFEGDRIHSESYLKDVVETENQLGERTTIGEAIVEQPKSRH